MSETLEQVKQAIVEGDDDAVVEQTERALEEGINPVDIVKEAIVPAIEQTGQLWKDNVYFLPDVVLSTEAFKVAMEVVEPKILESTTDKAGRFVMGVVAGDMHDLGKSIVIAMLTGAGFEVIDLGVDVSPEKFVETVRNEKPDILAISALITLTMPEVNNTLKALEEANLRNRVKIIVGGAPITQEFIDDIGADALAVNVIDGVKKCKRWVGA